MAKQKIFYWRVTVERPGTAAVTVEPVARDKLQASHRAAVMLGLFWKDVVKYMTFFGPYKATAVRVRQWNQEYPAWSTERETYTW